MLPAVISTCGHWGRHVIDVPGSSLKYIQLPINFCLVLSTVLRKSAANILLHQVNFFFFFLVDSSFVSL